MDIEALGQALRSKHLAGAAIDVFPSEPKGAGDEFVSPLREFDNVLLTPHIGGQHGGSPAEHWAGGFGKADQVQQQRVHFDGGEFSGSFAAGASRETSSAAHRIAISRACCRTINAIFSAERINVAAQYLQTNARIGYVVIDIETGGRQESLRLKQKLDEVPGTIRTRILY